VLGNRVSAIRRWLTSMLLPSIMWPASCARNASAHCPSANVTKPKPRPSITTESVISPHGAQYCCSDSLVELDSRPPRKHLPSVSVVSAPGGVASASGTIAGSGIHAHARGCHERTVAYGLYGPWRHRCGHGSLHCSK
jgi:hypothetical protein